MSEKIKHSDQNQSSSVHSNKPQEETEGQKTETPAKEGKSAEAANKPDPVTRTTLIVLAVCVLLFVWYLLADRFVPYTDIARVEAFVVPVVPQVSGTVIKVDTGLNQIVKQDQVVVQIDPNDYKLAVQQAEANLDKAGQEVGAGAAAVSSASAKLTDSQAKLVQAQLDFDRVERIFAQDAGAVSKAERDKTRTALDQAKSQVAGAEAELQKAKEQLGSEGEENPKIKAAISALKQARIDLERTVMNAPSLGVVTDVRIDEGHYAGAGQPLMTFISATDVWIQANMRENSIGNIKVGDSAEISLDVAPGRVFPGKVTSIGYGVGKGRSESLGALRIIEGQQGWLRDAQRFPVIIEFTDDSVLGLRRVGGQADVTVYTGDNWLLNALGWFWIRLMSVLSYVY
jgi:multidrug resistance efflux pump